MSLLTSGHPMGRFAVGMAAALLLQSSASAATFNLVNSVGFETPLNTTTFNGTGQLEGQSARTFGDVFTQQWLTNVGSTSTAVVQNAFAATGTQAVRVDRAPDSFDRFGVAIDGAPLLPYVCIEWDMMIPTQTSTGDFGPVFGIEANDDASGIQLAGSLMVDVKSLEVLYQATGTGDFISTGATVTYDTWNSFTLFLDYATDQYSVFLNNTLLATTGFVDGPGINEFSDASIAALARAGDPASLAATGTAYFDNYLVFETDFNKAIPEPSSLILAGIAATLVAFRRRAR